MECSSRKRNEARGLEEMEKGTAKARWANDTMPNDGLEMGTGTISLRKSVAKTGATRRKGRETGVGKKRRGCEKGPKIVSQKRKTGLGTIGDDVEDDGWEKSHDKS